MHWYMNDGPEKDAVISTRVRLARNIVDYPLGKNLDTVLQKEICEKVKNAFPREMGYEYVQISALAKNKQREYVEKKLSSPEMIGKNGNYAIVENEEKGLSVLVGEEDHVRIQAILSGFQPVKALENAFLADELLEESAKIAFDKRLGYLTHCPTNLGTGMRASAMMFLPMLTLNGNMSGLDASLQKLGLTVRGAFGEGSEAWGCIYQISNRQSLGLSENEILANVTVTATTLAEEERKMRLANFSTDLENRIMRSYGIGKYAVMTDAKEFYKLYADIRLGGLIGLFPVDLTALDRLTCDCMDGSLCSREGRELSTEERDKLRADLLREYLQENG